MLPFASADKSEAVSLIPCMSAMFWLIRCDKDSLGRGGRSCAAAANEIDADAADAGAGMEGKAEPMGASSAHQASSSCPTSVGVTVSEGNQAGASNFLRFGSSGSALTEVDPSRLRLFNNDWPSLKMAWVLATEMAGGRKPV